MPVLRAFQLTDRDDLMATINGFCAEGRWLSTSRLQPTPGWRHALEQPESLRYCLLIAKDQDRIVGWCRVLSPRCDRELAEAELGIGLVAAYRDRGLGTKLVDRALDWAREAGLERVWLRTRGDNARAHRILIRCGFCPSSLLDGWIRMTYQIGETAARGGGTCE